MPGSRESVTPRIQSSDIIACACQISSQPVLSYTQVSHQGKSWNRLSLDLGRAHSQNPWLGDSSASAQISSKPVSVSVVPASVPVHSITQLGYRYRPTGLSAPEATTTTFLCCRSFRLVYTTALIRPNGPYQPQYLGNPYLTFPGGLHDIYGCL